MDKQKEFKPANAATVILIMIVVMVISWAIIAGAMMYAVKSDLFEKVSVTASNISSSVSKSATQSN